MLGSYHFRGTKFRSHGTASLEFAIVAPLLITILVFIFDFGRVFQFAMGVSHAARVGAEYGSINSVIASDTDRMLEIATNEAQNNGITVDSDQSLAWRECTCLSGSIETPTTCNTGCATGATMLYYANVRLAATFNTVLQGVVTNLLNLDAIDIVRSARMRCSSY